MTDTNCRKRPRSTMPSKNYLVTAAAMAWLQLSSTTTTVNAFMTVRHGDARQHRSTTTLSFRNDAFSTFATASPLTSSPSATLLTPQLPTWLTIPKSHLATINLQSLHESMRATRFFTETEILRLRYAIEEAANGDAELVAGAAEFCQILAGETMEMGLHSLVAAAFHFCACVKARQRGERVISFDKNSLTQNFGKEAAMIASDAGRLKELEMVASRVLDLDASSKLSQLPTNSASRRVRPDARDSENLRKLLLSETRDWRALAIRSAACLFRLRGLLHNQSTQAASKALSAEAICVGREALNIYAPLASRLGMHRLKNELEGAAFMLLYNRQYQRVNPSNNPKRAFAMKRVLETVQEEMTVMLEQDEEFNSLVSDFSVTARVKEPYSLWKKMLQNRCTDILQVPDALALRIVLNAKKVTADEPMQVTRARERALCYYAQRLCVQRWKPASEPRFKDYIERPKRNGYQSLHYTAQTEWKDEDDDTNNNNEWSLEIQVRSGEMHQVAEFGLASHWDYKATQKKSKFTKGNKNCASDFTVSIEKDGQDIDRSSDAYLRKVQEWHWQQHGAATATVKRNAPLLQDDVILDTLPVSFETSLFHSALSESLSSTISSSLFDCPISESKLRADRIRARNQRLQPYLQALNSAQSDLTRENVFIFLSHDKDSTSPTEGKVLALPSGACVIDALREGERAMGYPMLWMKDDHLALNGAATSATRQLSNGDVLTFPLPRTVSSPSVFV